MRGRRVALLAAAAALLIWPSSAGAAKEHEYVVYAEGVYKYSGVSEWKRQDTETCDITDIEEVKYTAKFSAGPEHVTVSTKGDLFKPEELKAEVKHSSSDVTIYDHEPETSPCGADAEESLECLQEKPRRGTLMLADDVAAVNKPGVFDDYTLAPGRMTLSGELSVREDTYCYPTMLWPVSSGKYVQRPFLPYTTSDGKTKKLKKGAKTVELEGTRRLLESGTSGSNHSGTWHVGWNAHWELTFLRVE